MGGAARRWFCVQSTARRLWVTQRLFVGHPAPIYWCIHFSGHNVTCFSMRFIIYKELNIDESEWYKTITNTRAIPYHFKDERITMLWRFSWGSCLGPRRHGADEKNHLQKANPLQHFLAVDDPDSRATAILPRPPMPSEAGIVITTGTTKNTSNSRAKRCRVAT
jgi:hypothetical protein